MKTKAAIMTLLECPVCSEVPHTGDGPILGCRNGHIICQNCVEKVEKCPSCRENEIRCRNIVAERYIETELKNTPFNYKNAGCGVRLLMVNSDLMITKNFVIIERSSALPIRGTPAIGMDHCAGLSNISKKRSVLR